MGQSKIQSLIMYREKSLFPIILILSSVCTCASVQHLIFSFWMCVILFSFVIVTYYEHEHLILCHQCKNKYGW